MAAVRDFARKFDLVLKAFNLSRGRLAQTVGIDKSVVSRWASGTTVPTDHNLSLLTQAVMRHQADFGRADWDLDVGAFAARLGLAAVGGGAQPAPAPMPVVPEHPSVAVLPFVNMGGDPEQDYFADGITEDIITALSKWRSFLVIARNSTFVYKGRAVDVKQVARELGVRYVLEGSVRRAGNRMRIHGQLIDADSGGHVWAERYDGVVEDVFDLQDRICANIVNALEPELRAAELRRIRQKRPENLGAYDHYLQALAQFHAFSRDGNHRAQALLEKAIEADPSYALAHALLANCQNQSRLHGWGTLEAARSAGLAAAERALALGADDPTVLWIAGHIFTTLGEDWQRGRTLIDRSLTLNANCAPAWGVSGWNHAYSGEGQRAVDDMQRALRFSPIDPWRDSFYAGMAAGYITLKQFDLACVAAEACVSLAPANSMNWRFRASALALDGQLGEARKAIGKVLELEPGLTIEVVRRSRSNQTEERARKIYLEGLKRAGLPEK